MHLDTSRLAAWWFIYCQEKSCRAVRKGPRKISTMKICKYLSILFLGLLACERQEMAVVTEPLPPELVEHTLYASTPGGDEPQTRTLVSALDDNKVLWSAHEQASSIERRLRERFGPNTLVTLHMEPVKK